jgi:hypothetical protein
MPARSARVHRLRSIPLVGLLAVGLACSNNRAAPIKPPSFSASEGAEQALADYDTNRDGVIDREEAKRSPGLLYAFKSFDKNGDGKLSSEELQSQMATYSDTGAMSLNLTFLLDGNPLEGATVTCVPEKFMGPNYKPATGTTRSDGTVQPEATASGLPGMPYGVYRVEVSKKNAAGQETIPARYNTNTTFGVELHTSMRGSPPPYRLTSGR